MTSTEIRFASPHSISFGHRLRPSSQTQQQSQPPKTPFYKQSFSSPSPSFVKPKRSASFGNPSIVTFEEKEQEDEEEKEEDKKKKVMSVISRTEDLRERKRRFEEEFPPHNNNYSPPTARMYSRGSLDSGNGAVETSASVRKRNGHSSSPKGHYSHSYGQHHEEEDAITKRRRIEMEERNYAGGGGAAAAEEEEEYRRARMHAGYDRMEESRYGSNYPEHHRRSIGDELMDPAVPLARRRGDAAQAKASRLHIDTGSGAQEQHEMMFGGRSNLSASHPANHGIKSAPPSKLYFSDREEAEFDPRREAMIRANGGPQRRGEGPEAVGGPYNNRRADAMESVGYEGPDRRRGVVDHAHHNYEHGNPAGVGGGNGAMYRAGMAPSATPLTASRAFVPQTATLPSPAYHTTRFIGQAGGAAMAAAAATQSNIHSNVNQTNAREQVPPGPRTAGFNPPATARLPDHLRSPPSNKTQFLSLFSNFYDSLQDSRTLKATLEDQVRRSNTLLQTLQRSARVLELTVERRLNSERANWEQKIQALEERCHRLEGKTGAGSPTPTKEEIEIHVSNGDAKANTDAVTESEEVEKEKETTKTAAAEKEAEEVVKSKESEATDEKEIKLNKQPEAVKA